MSGMALNIPTLILLCAVAAHAQEVWPMADWKRATPAEAGMNEAELKQARDYALSAAGSGIIVRGGKAVMTWGDQRRRYDLKSSTKSIGVTALGLALKEGRIKALSDAARTYHPTLGERPPGNAKTGWLNQITVAHLANQTAGFAKPGGFQKLLFKPGTKWCYSDGGPNWLAECITLQYKRDLSDLLFERVFTLLGITAKDLTWRRNAYRPAKIKGITRREFGSGISANVDAMARIGLLYLRGGRWGRKQILPKSFVDLIGKTPRELRGLSVVGKIGATPLASNHYGLLWWNNADGALAGVPRDAFWSWGLYDSHIVVIPSLDVVVARAGRAWRRGGRTDYQVFGDFLTPICKSAMGKRGQARLRPAPLVPVSVSPGAPYPPSPVITGIEWAPKSTIVRKAKGSDNWPCTWGDDDALYTAYGDGWGFVPKVRGKLSLGLAKVTGSPPKIKGVNIRSKTGEQIGDGRSGRKASGLLMVDGVLYMWARNADRKGEGSQLAWSKDRGVSWTWADWRFAEFGYCTFINYGKDYAGARDKYIYVVSHDRASAYRPADRFVLMRVPTGKLAERAAYEFVVGLDKGRVPAWSKQAGKRVAVFEHKGHCRRSGLTYNAGLKRYLWWQVVGGGDTRSKGGFGVYDAPEPWGPWTTVFFTKNWDVGPGDCGSFPTKWMSRDGQTIHLVFSGDDSFSVRKTRLVVAASVAK